MKLAAPATNGSQSKTNGQGKEEVVVEHASPPPAGDPASANRNDTTRSEAIGGGGFFSPLCEFFSGLCGAGPNDANNDSPDDVSGGGKVPKAKIQNVQQQTAPPPAPQPQGISKDMCRSMLAMLDADSSGKLGLEEFKALLSDIAKWKVSSNDLLLAKTEIYKFSR